MYFERNQCRACHHLNPERIDHRLVPVFELAPQPLPNDFRTPDEEHEGFAPLRVMLCPYCHLAQLSVMVRPEIMYSRYTYVTSRSKMMRDHFTALEQEIVSLGGTGKVLEIGSNDGTLLDCLRTKGYEVFGIDPAANLATKANGAGIPTVCGLFNEETAKTRLHRAGPFGVILARHVFCHVDDWHDFVKALELVSDSDTLIGIEVPHAEKMLRGVEWDTIYFEHLSYFTLKGMDALLRGTNFHIHRVTDYAIHGGSIVVWLRRNEWSYGPDVDERILNEKAGVPEWVEFATKSYENISALKALVMRLNQEGKVVAGFGASAKATVCINACGFTQEHIAYVTDTTPEKIGTRVPGTNIPVVSQDVLKQKQPDYMVLFCWNFIGCVLNEQKAYLENGGKFILYVPGVRVIP